METINIAGSTYAVKFTFKAIKLFEELAKKPITQCIDTWDNLTFFYCSLKAANDTFKMDFAAFVDYLDEHPELLIQFQTADILNGQAPDTEPAKKKYSPKMIFIVWMLLPLFAVSPVLVPIISIILWILTSLWLLATLIKQAGSKRAS